VKLPKLHPKESFEGLDLLTTLLAPKKKAPATIKPFIELIGEPIYMYMYILANPPGLSSCLPDIHHSDI